MLVCQPQTNRFAAKATKEEKMVNWKEKSSHHRKWKSIAANGLWLKLERIWCYSRYSMRPHANSHASHSLRQQHVGVMPTKMSVICSQIEYTMLDDARLNNQKKTLCLLFLHFIFIAISLTPFPSASVCPFLSHSFAHSFFPLLSHAAPCCCVVFWV